MLKSDVGIHVISGLAATGGRKPPSKPPKKVRLESETLNLVGGTFESLIETSIPHGFEQSKMIVLSSIS
jgi:hypothetical protein